MWFASKMESADPWLMRAGRIGRRMASRVAVSGVMVPCVVVSTFSPGSGEGS